MLVIRPITLGDLDQLEALAAQAGVGLTTLPRDRQILRRRILDSEHGFRKMADKPGGETYLFVMEDTDTAAVVGTCGIVAKVGGFEPFYAYEIETSVHESQMLGVRKEIRALHLVREHNGPCEIGSLFLRPDYRHSGNGRLLSLSRFLFMAQHREFFDPQVIAEMRGVIDQQGRSAFWDALGKHFFEVEYPTADYLSMVNKKFIADLMPTHPIYIPLLPQAAQDVIGQVHPDTRPALHMLEAEGFTFSGMVDIFEAGPVMTCPLDQIRTVRGSRQAVVTKLVSDPGTAPQLIANTATDFRVCRGPVVVENDGQVALPQDVAVALNVKPGDTVRYVDLPSPAKKTGKAP